MQLVALKVWENNNTDNGKLPDVKVCVQQQDVIQRAYQCIHHLYVAAAYSLLMDSLPPYCM